MQDPINPLLPIAGFAIGFPLFWMAIVYLVSRMSGWAALAKQFAYDGPAEGEEFNFCSARIRLFSNYGNCLKVSLSSAGIHIRTMIFFRIGHEPLRIPWTAVEDVVVRSYWLFSSARVKINAQALSLIHI